MTAAVLEFPARRRAAIFIIEDSVDGVLVLAPNDHGWVHSDLRAARLDAEWLSDNFGLPILEQSA